MSLEKALVTAQTQVPECVAVGYVDMSTGMLLGSKTVDSHPAEVLDLVAAATADLFQGPSVSTIEKLFRRSRGQQEDGRHYFQEIFVMSENLLHIFMRGKKNPSQAVCFVCRASVNIGMALSKSRQALPALEASV
ncbi:hypothetical protein [Hyalangium gracile]|uniref:hypothetical protein n=1 Tax=Hyalangium gracile TaxID=394092 RepID=UPI001CCA05FE|nr:hypothetical protein [Hyalangium gracile]